MRMNDKILYKYFLSEEHYQQLIEAALQERDALLECAYPHTVYTELGLATVGGNLERSVVEAIEIEERISRIKSSIDKIQCTFKKAIKLIGTRKRIILFVYFKTGITLTNKSELIDAQERMINILEDVKEKEDRSLKKEYVNGLNQAKALYGSD